MTWEITQDDQARRPAVPAHGLLEKLVAAVRPEFRAEVLVFAAADPVFGSGVCLVDGCELAVRAAGMCDGHSRRWKKAGRPDQASSRQPSWRPGWDRARCRPAGAWSAAAVSALPGAGCAGVMPAGGAVPGSPIELVKLSV